MEHQGFPVYILGRTIKDIRRVSSSVLGFDEISDELNEVWIVHRSVKLQEGCDIQRICVEERKGITGLTVDSHLDRKLSSECGSLQAQSQHMDYLKSVSESSSGQFNDNGYESEENINIQTNIVDHDAIETDVHEIALTTNPASELPSLILHRFIRAGIFILAVETESLEQNMDLFERTLKELGTYKVLTKAEYTQLLVVDISGIDKQKKDMKRTLFNRIRTSYFGDHFDVCEVKGLKKKIKKIVLDSISRRIWPSLENTKQNSLRPLLKHDNTFIDKTQIDKPYDSFSIEESETFCFQIRGKNVICCRPDKLVKTLVDLLYGLKRKGKLSDCVSVDTFTADIDFQEVNIVLSALSAAELIIVDGNSLVHVLPLVAPGLLPQFDEEREFSVETNILRLEIDADVIPVNVMLAIIMSCVHEGWSVKTAAPKACVSKQSVMLEKGSFGLIITFGISTKEQKAYTGLCMVRFQTDGSSSDMTDCNDCEEIRVVVERSIKECETKQGLRVCGQSIRKKTERDALKMDSTNWTDVTPMLDNNGRYNGVKVVDLFNHWYSSKSREIEETMNRDLSDDVLIKVAEAFGKGYQRFFIDQKISSTVVERIEEENPRDVIKTVFQLLKEWRRMNGYAANLSNLKAAINCSSVSVDLNKLKQISLDFK